MNEQVKDILLVALGGGMLFGVLYLACLGSEKYRKWQRAKSEEEYEAWLEKRRKLREEREAAQAKSSEEETRRVKEERPPEPVELRGEHSAIERSNRDKTRRMLSERYAALAQSAYAEGGVLVEAYFYALLARMNGHRQIGSLISQIRVTWRQLGYPSEKGLFHDDFGALESAMSRACLRIDSRHDAELGVMSLTELAQDGNEFAKTMLAERGLGEGSEKEH